ncbi:unnamed protein product [Closterium sp. NIES-64]|nr:unnamed protein product [Closterium sp. NIES-64]
MAAVTTSSQVATAVARIAASASASSPQPASSLSQSSSSRIAATSPLRLAAPSRRASIQTRHAIATDRLVQGDKAEEKVKAEQDKEEEEAAESIHDDLPVPTAFEIQSLLMELCDETNIAELRIKIGKMELHVLRDVGGVKAAQAQAYAPHAPLPPMFDSLSPTSLAAASAPPAPVAAPPAVAESEAGVDEGLQYVTSPRVGIMRRGRQVKGKKGKPLVAEGSEIKKGQVVCYLEQLGTQLAIESENAGEVVKFLVEDGDAVGFGDALVAIRPSFPGIKKLAL